MFRMFLRSAVERTAAPWSRGAAPLPGCLHRDGAQAPQYSPTLQEVSAATRRAPLLLPRADPTWPELRRVAAGLRSARGEGSEVPVNHRLNL